MDETYSLAQVKERSIGALFFSIFGGLWLGINFSAFGLLTHWTALVLSALTVAFIPLASKLLKAVPRGTPPDPQRRRNGRMFARVNAAQGIAIFLVFQFAYSLHHPNAAFDLAVPIFGLHMFALPRSYRIASNLVTGAILVIASVLCPILFRGDLMVAAVTLCSGLTLWSGALWKLKAAVVLLRTSHGGSPLQP